MAKESSFDIVSTVDMQEIDNACQQAKREISQRYDLKDSGSEVSLDKNEKIITVKAPSDFVAKQVVDVVSSKLVKRKIDLAAVTWGDAKPAAGSTVVRTARIVDGIDRDCASTISKDIRSLKLKVKVQIEGDQLRVSSAKIDTLQDVIAFLRDKDYGQPLQFVNYR